MFMDSFLVGSRHVRIAYITAIYIVPGGLSRGRGLREGRRGRGGEGVRIIKTQDLNYFTVKYLNA